MKYDALVFDLDGTLWDATYVSTCSWNDALRSLGIKRTITEQEMESVTGKPTKECIKILLSEENAINENLLEAINFYEREAIIRDGGVLYKDCVDTINLLKDKINHNNFFFIKRSIISYLII